VLLTDLIISVKKITLLKISEYLQATFAAEIHLERWLTSNVEESLIDLACKLTVSEMDKQLS
jgi:hypothetical protein